MIRDSALDGLLDLLAEATLRRLTERADEKNGRPDEDGQKECVGEVYEPKASR